MTSRDQKYQEEFGRNLRKLREERDWTQMDLAAVSRVNETQISKIENGEYAPNLQTIRALAVALGKYPAELLDFQFDFKLNTNFVSQRRKAKKPSSTQYVNTLIADGFFKSPKTVSSILEFCKTQYKIALDSADVSGVLLRMVKEKRLRKTLSQIKGRHLYQNRS